MNNEKRSRITIRYIDGDCVVELHDKDNILLLQQPVLDEDPYLFISRLREAVDGAQISEEPKLSEGGGDPTPHPFIKVIDGHIEEMKRMKEQLHRYLYAQSPQGEDNERSFTENLT
jgi:hypothetical protein